MKKCGVCGEVKDESKFSPARPGGVSRGPMCLKCKSEYISRIYHTNAEYREKVKLKNRKQRYIRRSSACEIICKHHKDLKDDPDHLTTEFIQKVVGRKCKKP